MTWLVEGHANSRGIQSGLQELLGVQVSLGTISAMVQSAGQQAQRCLEQLVPSQQCALALYEQESSTRGEASLNVVDVHRSLVWARVPPVPVDGERGTVLLHIPQEHGVQWHTTVSDGGRAMAEALKQTEALATHQRDVWHLLPLASHVQRRVGRHVQASQEQWETVKHQAERVAQGQKARGRAAQCDVVAHVAHIEQMRRVAEGCASLFSELHRLWQTVGPALRPEEGIVKSASRQSEVETVVLLLTELGKDAPAALQREIQRVCTQVRLALPHLLLFPRSLDGLQEHVTAPLGPEALSLMAWAWQRRAILRQNRQELLEGFHPPWCALAATLLHAWDLAVRASSAVENGHRMVRPHVSIHRTLSAEMLALLAMRQNHRVAPRGLHAGWSPFARRGFEQPETDWLLAFGYPPCVASLFNVSHGFEPCLSILTTVIALFLLCYESVVTAY